MMRSIQRVRRTGLSLVILLMSIVFVALNPEYYSQLPQEPAVDTEVVIDTVAGKGTALEALGTLEIKGRAPKTGYERTLFGSGWKVNAGCDTRNTILNRDLKEVVIDDSCKVVAGILADPYTGKVIEFKRGADSSKDVQIDHVVALNDAWQKGAQEFDAVKRVAFANDPLELLAVDGPANQQKSSGDAATWLPSNKPFRCQYVARQVAIKQKYDLWVNQAEHDAIAKILSKCPTEPIPVAKRSVERV